MDTLEKIHQSGIAPTEFWYIATFVFGGIILVFLGILIFFLKGFFLDLKATIKELVDSVGYLKNLATVYGTDITQLKKEVNEVKDDIKTLEKRRRP